MIFFMMATLEPNSYFIDKKDLERIRVQNKDFFEGVGLEITTRE
jgi:nitrogen fixation protein